MAEHKDRFELIKTYKERQDKLTYYVMGLSVASIGFSISKTFNTTFNSNHIYLGIAILFWFISIITATAWILTQLRGMEINLALSEVIQGHHELRKIDETQKKRLLNEMKKKLEKVNMRSGRLYRSMLIMFILGVGAFIIWRIFEMI